MRIKGYFYRDKDQAFLVDKQLEKDINKAVAHGWTIDTGGKVIYPILDDPSESEIRAGKTKVAAWWIKPNQIPTLRWYWQIQEHHKNHSYCKSLGDGLCGFKMVRFYNWDETSKKWELLPMINHATAEQEKVLDSN